MKTFKDSEKREWEIVVNVRTAKAVRDLTMVDLFKLHTDEAERVFSDPCLLVDVLYVLCRDQCATRKMTDEEFGRSLTGDAIEDAADALLGAVADFFPSARRQLLQKQMGKAHELTDVIMKQANQTLDGMDVNAIFSKLSMKSQASSE